MSILSQDFVPDELMGLPPSHDPPISPRKAADSTPELQKAWQGFLAERLSLWIHCPWIDSEKVYDPVS